ncbi:hypothetical protein QAO71_17900 (plasmid) [Halopseudomonas sp. SMJS2]|uniref:hypothetical protein n=1 Tax=Halopseudomonas sp. SMJS2 TaxID=3041098 RepID=UPI00245300D8|nr:hypothetical protein [Halopseudomonas sp. SMJS2]WGK63416.1 hypothetical protein QAO71_17900 [Halopseudomonas sp. SMJS2]
MNNELNRKDRIDRLVSQAQVVHDDLDDGGLELAFEDQACDDANALAILFSDIADQVGIDFLEQMPLELLEQFSMMTVARNEATGLLLRNLLLGFMQAYANPKTTDRAIEALLVLESLGDLPKASVN